MKLNRVLATAALIGTALMAATAATAPFSRPW